MKKASAQRSPPSKVGSLEVKLDKSKAEHAPYRKKSETKVRKPRAASSKAKVEPTRLIGGTDFVLVALTFDSKAAALNVSEAEFQRLVRAKVSLRKGFRRFSDVPERPLTRVFQIRLSKKIGDPGTACEVARSAAHPTLEGRSYFISTHGSKAVVAPFKVTL